MIITSDALRKHWWALSENARSFHRILCENQDGVPKQELLATTDDGFSKILGWIGRAIEEAGGGRYYQGECYEWGEYATA